LTLPAERHVRRAKKSTAGEGHGLGNNPWHGRIKVREELKWLEKYGEVPATVDKSK